MKRDCRTNERGASCTRESEKLLEGDKQEMRRGGRARGPSGTEGVLINTDEARVGREKGELDAKKTGKKGGTSVATPVPVRLAYRLQRALPGRYLECVAGCLEKHGRKGGASVAADDGGGRYTSRSRVQGRPCANWQPEVPRRDAPQVARSLTGLVNGPAKGILDFGMLNGGLEVGSGWLKGSREGRRGGSLGELRTNWREAAEGGLPAGELCRGGGEREE
ncbi:hypothetical protein J3F83DRAFT_725683 [Trichoderma novae-zelandiae]